MSTHNIKVIVETMALLLLHIPFLLHLLAHGYVLFDCLDLQHFIQPHSVRYVPYVLHL